MYEISEIPYKFIAIGAANKAKSLLYQIKEQDVNNLQPGIQFDSQVSSASIAVTPDVSGVKFYNVGLSLGVNELANDINIAECTISLTRSKNIVRTAINGLNGTIKEYISDGDFEINMQVGIQAVEDGVFVDKYPEEGVAAIRELLEVNGSLYVSSDFLRIFDITKIVIVDYSIKQMTYTNSQQLTIRAISDTDYVINNTEY